MSSGLAKAIIKKGLFILNWVVRIALIILYVALASGRGWIALLFLCMVSLDIAVKKGWYIVLDISLAVFFILSLLPCFVTRDLTNTAHFYMLQDRYECVAEECMKLDVDDFVHITEPQYKIEKNEVKVGHRKNGVYHYRFGKEGNPFLYRYLEMEEQGDTRVVYLRPDSLDSAGYMYIADDKGRELLGIDAPYGIGAPSGFCIPKGAAPDKEGELERKPCRYRWLNEHWLYFFEEW